MATDPPPTPSKGLRKPLNGFKTHPLAPASLAVLRELLTAPKPRQAINPGVDGRLMREDLVEMVDLRSPYATHKGRLIAHLQVTAAGLARLAQR